MSHPTQSLSKIKSEHAKKKIAFGTSGKAIGKRDDIDELAIIAHRSNDQKLKDLFEKLPSLDELLAAKTAAETKDLKLAKKVDAGHKKPAHDGK